jgi:hypothetical protein
MSLKISEAANESGQIPKILYVGGVGRSGSTLVGRVLGEASDSLCVGETRYLWSRGLLHNVECGCGQPFRSCTFWTEVGDCAFGGWQNIDVQRLIELDNAVNRLRALPFQWIPSLRPGFAAIIDEYTSYLGKLYIAMSRVSRAKIIVETSKEPNFASVLAQIPDSRVHLIHLVRDSRAVAYSWTRNRRMPSPIGDQTLMPQFSPRYAATRWAISNAAFHALGRTAPYIRINYEDFVTNPSTSLRIISNFAQEAFDLGDTQLSDKKVKLGEHHIFSGNPMRSNTGWLDMRLDDEWQSTLPASRQAEVIAMTWPLLRLYGYPVVPSTIVNQSNVDVP